MLNLTPNKLAAMKRLSDENGIIGALAIDQRGSLKKMIGAGSANPIGDEGIIRFKELRTNDFATFDRFNESLQDEIALYTTLPARECAESI